MYSGIWMCLSQRMFIVMAMQMFVFVVQIVSGCCL